MIGVAISLPCYRSACQIALVLGSNEQPCSGTISSMFGVARFTRFAGILRALLLLSVLSLGADQANSRPSPPSTASVNYTRLMAAYVDAQRTSGRHIESMYVYVHGDIGDAARRLVKLRVKVESASSGQKRFRLLRDVRVAEIAFREEHIGPWMRRTASEVAAEQGLTFNSRGVIDLTEQVLGRLQAHSAWPSKSYLDTVPVHPRRPESRDGQP